MGGVDCGERLDGVIRGDREDESLGGAVERVARAADPLDEGRDLTGRVVLDHPVDGPDVDTELERRRGHEAFDLPAFEARLDPLALLPGQGTVVDRDILTDHRQAGAEELGEGTGVHEDERRAALVEGVVDRGEAGRGLRGDVEVASGLEVLVDGTRPFDSILVSFLERREEDFEGLPAAEERGDRIRVTHGGGKADALEIPLRNSTEPLKPDRQLDPAPVLRELMDFIDDDVSHRLEVTLHQFPGEDRLQGLRGGDEDVGGIGGLLSAIRSRRVAVPHGGCETRGRYEALDTVDQIPIKGSQGRDVEGPDPIPLAGP